ncbi:MAG: redoxin domain-containing protein [Dehalococcoidia bacterium]|nr:redoxin domain-containing protein [Dehalococcoidia bacterium]MSQ35248.1 redoxin domain-containing protein [Dehalococcoidia bacterium]
MNAEVLEISVDSVHAQKTWAEQLKDVPFPILSDFWPHGAVGKMFGIFNEERGMDRRSVFLLDASHTVRWSKTYEPGTIPQSAELLENLKGI